MREATVLQIRAFNRFYLPALDLLGNHYLDSEYCAAEARVLYEIYENDGCNAARISKSLNIDKSYLSRILQSHEKRGYLTRTKSQTDSRAYDLHLTELGRARTEDFIRKSNEQISRIIAPLNDDACQALSDALNTVARILRSAKEDQS